MRMLPALLCSSAALLAAGAPARAAVEVTVVAGVPGAAPAADVPDGSPALATAISPRGLYAPDRHTVLFSDDCGVVREVARDRITRVAGIPACGETPVLAPPSFGDAPDPFAARLSGLVGLGRGADGELVLADAGYHRVRALTAGGVTTLAGTGTKLGDGGFADGPAAAARLDQPGGAQRLADGRVVIADSGNGRVRVLAGGRVSTLAGGGTAAPADGAPATGVRFGMVGDVTAQPGGAVVFTDVTGGAVWRVGTDGVLRAVARGLSLPFGIDARGPELVVAELGAGRIDRIAADGSVAVLTSAVRMPYAVAVAPCTGDVLASGFAAADARIYRLHEGRGNGCRYPPGLVSRG